MKYTCIKQHDITDCGAACLATVSRQYGLATSITKIREIAGTDLMGTNIFGMVKAAEQLGFTAKGVKGDIETFFSEFPLPAIAHVVIDDSLLHYVVIHKITKKEVLLADPAKGLIKMKPEEFFELWTGVLILLVPQDTFKKGKDTKNLFERFFHLLLPQKKLMIDVFLASIVLTLLGLLGAFYFQFIVDEILPGELKKTLLVLSIGVILLNLFSIALSAIRTQLLIYLSQKLDIALLLGYYDHVLKLPMNFFGTRKAGEIISRFQDASSIRDAISNATLTVMIDTLMAFAGGVLLFLKHQKLFLIALGMVAIYAILVCVFNKPYKKAYQRQMEDNAQLTSYLVESLNGIQTVKAFNAERQVAIATELRFVKQLKSIFHISCIGNLQESLTALVESLGQVFILWVGALAVMNGEMTIGSLIAFQALLSYFLDPVENLINLQPQLQTAFVASDRLGEILDLEIEKDMEKEKHKVQLEHLGGAIAMKHVSFRYGTRAYVMEDFSLDIAAGERIAIVGESGAGKSTLAKLLLNFYQPEKGTITINDLNLQDIAMDSLREKIAYVPQETFLFSGSVYENLTFGMEQVDMEELIGVCKLAQVHDFVNELPLRYETRLDENGSNLSGGQRQRIAIARAMLKKPDILILDEATSNLDAVTERVIQDTLQEYTKEMTTIIIAHRLSTIRMCDRILVMDHGKIVEIGSHEQLMAIENGTYRSLYRAQVEAN